MSSEQENILKQVFDQHCSETGCHPDSPAAREAATALVDLFTGGLTEAEDLILALAGWHFMRSAG